MRGLLMSREFLSEEEAMKARARLEKEMKQAGDDLEKTPELTIQDLRAAMQEFYELMDYVIDYYMDIPKETKNIVILWTLGTYFHKNFSTYPYLFVNAMRSSGKTRLLKIIQAFSNQGQLTMSLTEAVMFRTTGTLLIDEFEGVNRKGVENLRELLNSAYKRGTKVFRMKKKKTAEGETQVVEDFQPYRPIVMANIWGMEEVLGDRCINVQLEKSDDGAKTKLVEDFENFERIKSVKNRVVDCLKCSFCSVVASGNVYSNWNQYLKSKYTTLNHTTTLPTLNNSKLHEKEIDLMNTNQMLAGNDIILDFSNLFDKIFASNIDGRHLELFFPLFLTASEVNSTTLDYTIDSAKTIINDKKIDEITESKDVAVYALISQQQPNTFYDVSSLTSIFRMMMGEGENEWINSKWLGRSLKRLNLIAQKRRLGSGVQVMLHVGKANQKKEMFKPKEEVRA